jgi:hypothetical protein
LNIPSDIDYKNFTDQQIEAFASAAGIPYANPSLEWVSDLDEAARDLLFDYAAADWPTPSRVLNQLEHVRRDPDAFLKRLEDEPDLRLSPLATAIIHGTKWHPDALVAAAKQRDEFLAGVNREIGFLSQVIKCRKDRRITGNGGKPGVARFIERLTQVFNDAFWCDVNSGLCVPRGGGSPTGPFISFAKAVVAALELNLPDAMKDSELPAVLRGMAAAANTAIWSRLTRSDNYNLTRQLKKRKPGKTSP